MINAKLQSIIDTKSAIGNAIVNKGGTITGETPFFNYAAQIDGISTGTPQTIFAASDGSKWALTNVVNIVNSAGNVTYDFNRWQTANNGTSDPILNIGTVGANISGNIRIVQVNQVNQAQYGNIVANDTTGAKYVGYNGYDAITNPTPSGNTTFNRWVLNNSASGTIVFSNGTFIANGTYNGPNTTINEANISLILEKQTVGGNTIGFYNGFVYARGLNTSVIGRYNSALDFLGFANWTNGTVITATGLGEFVFNGSLLYTKLPGGKIIRLSTSLGSTGAESWYSYDREALKENGDFLYTSGFTLAKTNKAIFANSTERTAATSFSHQNFDVALNNGFIYTGGDSNGGITRIVRFHESNLVNTGVQTINIGTVIRNIAISDNFLYVGTGSGIRKFHEGNLALVSNGPLIGRQIWSIYNKGDFLFAGTDIGDGLPIVHKIHKSNMTIVANASSNNLYASVRGITIGNESIYAIGSSSNIFRISERQITADNQSIQTITKIKE